jgi:hypothetical protein
MAQRLNAFVPSSERQGYHQMFRRDRKLPFTPSVGWGVAQNPYKALQNPFRVHRILSLVTQGSRQRRQPWAGLHNRFAVGMQKLHVGVETGELKLGLCQEAWERRTTDMK